MNELDAVLSKYDYEIPDTLIAQEPASPRDAARLLAYSQQKKIASLDTFANIAAYLPKGAVLVFNQTKVIPARLWVKKETGGKAQLLYIGQERNLIKVIADRKLPVGSVLSFSGKIRFIISEQQEQFYLLKPNFPLSELTKVLTRYGETPLPPYIKHSKLSESERRKKYQAVFAKSGLSVAAPTASLHFTRRLLTGLRANGFGLAFVTLNVNLGTFAPLKENNLKTGTLHTEEYEIDARTVKLLNEAKRAGRPIIPVGTTALRALESAAAHGRLARLKGSTRLFIREGYEFRFIDGLVTNFHVPKSSLLMLVSALIGRKKLFGLYKLAIKNRFKFFSFGDGMLIVK